jgi:hypothetical protein
MCQKNSNEIEQLAKCADNDTIHQLKIASDCVYDMQGAHCRTN